MSAAALESFRIGKQAEFARETAVVHDFLNHVRRSSRGDAALCLTLAGEKLLTHGSEAVDLYADVAGEHDLREAWFGLACAHHLRGRG